MRSLLPQILSLTGIVALLYFAYDGVFQGGGSDSVFIGVAILSAVLLGCKMLEKLLQE